MLFPVKDLGATFSRNSDADETLELVEEVLTVIICNALARVSASREISQLPGNKARKLLIDARLQRRKGVETDFG